MSAGQPMMALAGDLDLIGHALRRWGAAHDRAWQARVSGDASAAAQAEAERDVAEAELTTHRASFAQLFSVMLLAGTRLYPDEIARLLHDVVLRIVRPDLAEMAQAIARLEGKP